MTPRASWAKRQHLRRHHSFYFRLMLTLFVRCVGFPPLWATIHIGPEFPSDCAGDGPPTSSTTILSANITSMRKNWCLLESLECDYYFLQETTLNQTGQKTMNKLLNNSGYQCAFGKPCEYKLSGKQTRISTWNARPGGLATMPGSHSL